MTAEQQFERLRAAITNSCNAKNYSLATDAAKELGMQLTDVSKAMMLILQGELKHPDSKSVALEFRSYDQSKPFQILPDSNRFDLKLLQEGKTLESFSDRYED